MYFGLALSQLCSELPTAQVDIEKSRLNASMPSKRGNFMDVPIRSSEIGKAEVAWCVRGELLHTRAIGKFRNPLGPSPDRERLS
jgi:hypothetical protein